MLPYILTTRPLIHLILCVQAVQLTVDTQDQTSARTNTLFDDADDIQKQLDNEARDRIKYGRPKTVWVFHFPTQFPVLRLTASLNEPEYAEDIFNEGSYYVRQVEVTSWNYKEQDKWHILYPNCGGKSQSPVNLPNEGLIKARGARHLRFCNYNISPTSWTLHNDVNRLILYGKWNDAQRPLVYGGAAHSRRYLFHSLILHWPSEHFIGGVNFPMETQVIHISAEYKTIDEAIKAAPSDPLALLGVINLYKYGNQTHSGLMSLLQVVTRSSGNRKPIPLNPLSYFNPPFKEYAVYQGSLSAPPCTESVLWLVRGRTLSVDRDVSEEAFKLMSPDGSPMRHNLRVTQPLNDRRVFFFN